MPKPRGQRQLRRREAFSESGRLEVVKPRGQHHRSEPAGPRPPAVGHGPRHTARSTDPTVAAGSCKEREAPGAGSSKLKPRGQRHGKAGSLVHASRVGKTRATESKAQRATTYGPLRGTPQGCHRNGAPADTTQAPHGLRSRVRSERLRTLQRESLKKGLMACQTPIARLECGLVR